MSTFLEQLRPYAPDADAYGRLYADFTDLAEACRWFCSIIGATDGKVFSESELQDLLIDIDVRFIQHASFHLDSLRKELSRVLESFSAEDDSPTQEES